jgi:flagellar biosynthesis protein FlhF
MHLKRYRSATVREALALARHELGPDALVLSTRLVPLRGLRGWLGGREVELTAAHDSVMSGSRPSARSADMPTQLAAAQMAAATKLAGPDPRHDARLESRLKDLEDDEMPPLVKDASSEAMIARLCATGLHRELAERIVANLPKLHRRNGSIATLEKTVADEMGTFAAGEEPYAAVEVFVGPPGAGKTTTIAKIAAQERARKGAKLNLLAADGFRVGAVEQLRLYADIIGSSFSVARTPAEIERTILTTRGTVLVDTAGRSVRDPRAQEVVSMLAGLPGVRTHLVVPAASSVRDLRRVLDTYGDKSPNRVVLTRVDETDSVSPLLHFLEEHDLKISYLGTGQRVPEDLERATPARLAAHVLGHGVPSMDVAQGYHA